MRKVFLQCLLVWLVNVANSEAFADVRVALVIGNGAYLNAPQLPNPKNDATDVAVALKRDGFDTTLLTDLDKNHLEEATIAFAKAARQADVALFYYSGHALQFGGVNYLAPIDIKLTDEADLRRMVRLDDIVADLQLAKSLRVLVLDSCRDNPLAQDLKRSIGTTRALSLQSGLAKIDTQGLIVSYATQAGRTAEDGDGRNSPYTTAFLKHIEEQEEIGTIFRRIGNDVYATTAQKQLPELSLSITGEFYLRGRITAQPVLPKDDAQPAQTDKSASPNPSSEMHFKHEFDGSINPPEAETYRVIHDNVVAKAGPDDSEDGLFRLQLSDEVKGSAEYSLLENNTDIPYLKTDDFLEKTWVKIVGPSGAVGFVKKVHLITPTEFERWTEIQGRIQKLATFFDRAQKENTGPYASFMGVYCSGAMPCAGVPSGLNRSTINVIMSVRYLMWFEGTKIHLVNIVHATEGIMTMEPEKPVSFDSKEPPWNVKNIPSFKILSEKSQPQKFAFSSTALFYANYGDKSFGAAMRAKSLSVEKMQILTRYMIDVAETYSRGNRMKTTPSN